jgi:adenylosuccinate synthase
VATRLVSVLGLAFGDCGKGLFTDYLSRHSNAHTVVRFNGGGQAGHNVVLPDGRSHTFSQFGAGTFNAGVCTVLAFPVIVHPGALLIEHEVLQRSGINDAFERLLIDARCRVTTPFHQAAGRLRELARGQQAHGSCGVGVGETVGHGLEHAGQIIHYADLARPAVALAKAQALRETLLAQFDPVCAAPANQARYDSERRALQDATLAQRWLIQIAPLLRLVPPASLDAVSARLHLAGTVLFEGAQGVLLDEWRGFHPHTTWSGISPASVQEVVSDAGQSARIEHLGVLRTYLTRHGAGPLPTHEPRLDVLSEPHNVAGGWQGAFRRGHPDALLLRYALAVTAPLDGLLVSHLDVFESPAALRWCDAYDIEEEGGRARIGGIVPGAPRDLHHQARLAQMLATATPCYGGAVIGSAAQFIDELQAIARLPVRFGARGPTHLHVQPWA